MSWLDHHREEKKYRGLRNQGATCYLNSILQVLHMTKEFREALERNTSKNVDCIDDEIQSLFAGPKDPADTCHVTRKLGIVRVNEQRDAAECLEKILNLTSENASQEDSIAKFFDTSDFSGENQMYCETCDQKSDAINKCVITHHPDVLTLLLKRFEFDYNYMQYIKINRTVDVPFTLEIEGQVYELYAFVDHSGDLRWGHYTATIRPQDDDDDDRWLVFNDTSITVLAKEPFLNENIMKSKNAYLLFYKKKKNPSAGTGNTEDCKGCEDDERSVKGEGVEERGQAEDNEGDMEAKIEGNVQYVKNKPREVLKESDEDGKNGGLDGETQTRPPMDGHFELGRSESRGRLDQKDEMICEKDGRIRGEEQLERQRKPSNKDEEGENEELDDIKPKIYERPERQKKTNQYPDRRCVEEGVARADREDDDRRVKGEGVEERGQAEDTVVTDIPEEERDKDRFGSEDSGGRGKENPIVVNNEFDPARNLECGEKSVSNDEGDMEAKIEGNVQDVKDKPRDVLKESDEDGKRDENTNRDPDRRRVEEGAVREESEDETLPKTSHQNNSGFDGRKRNTQKDGQGKKGSVLFKRSKNLRKETGDARSDEEQARGGDKRSHREGVAEGRWRDVDDSYKRTRDDGRNNLDGAKNQKRRSDHDVKNGKEKRSKQTCSCFPFQSKRRGKKVN
ncbi:uncharacterized protein ACBR49_019037 [Aulostomus maculatus]